MSKIKKNVELTSNVSEEKEWMQQQNIDWLCHPSTAKEFLMVEKYLSDSGGDNMEDYPVKETKELHKKLLTIREEIIFHKETI